MTFLCSILSTVMGGLALAFLFFLLRECVFPLPPVAGRWYVEVRFKSSSLDAYRGMLLRYIAVLWREGSSIKGSAEKVYECTATGEIKKYIGEERIRAEIGGYAEKLIFSRDVMSLHIVEEGAIRQSTSFHQLKVCGSGPMTGRFISTAADAEGEVTWQRQPF